MGRMRVLLPLPPPPDPVQAAGEAAALESAYAYPRDRAWLRANMVASVDGAASAHGRSRGLSTPADKRVFRVLRALADVIVVEPLVSLGQLEKR